MTTLGLRGGFLEVSPPKELALRLQDLFPSDGPVTAATLSSLKPEHEKTQLGECAFWNQLPGFEF